MPFRFYGPPCIYARAHIGFMYCGNLDILFVYPSHLGPWATFGGLVRLVVGRVQDFFSRILVILCLLGSNYQFYATSPKFN